MLGAVQSAGAVGGLIGGSVLAAWGGPKKKIHGVLGGWISFGAIGLVFMGLGQSYWVWMLASFLMMLVNPMLNGSNQAIWQSKVAPEVQGRVFSVRAFIAQITAPVSMAIAGPLADKVFEPVMDIPGHWFTGLLGPIVGIGPGARMSFLILISGILVAMVGIGAYQIKQIRDVETLIPDHLEN